MNFEEIIDRHLDAVNTDDPIKEYRCDQHEYSVTYSLSLKQGTYRFDSDGRLDINHLSEKSVSYYVSSGYWREL